MSRYLKITLQAVGLIIGIVILLWFGIIIYINLNKDKFATIITEQVNDEINGILTIDEVEPTIIREFPDISFKLNNVVLRDSMWAIHQQDYINLNTVYVSFDLLSAFKKDAYIEKITLTDGTITQYTENDTITNTRIFKKKEQKKDSKTKNLINNFELTNIVFKVIHKEKNKDFEFGISNCDVLVSHNDTGFTATVNLEAGINSFAFNTDKGSFIKDKQVDASLNIDFNEDKSILRVPIQTIQLDNFDYNIGGNYYFTDTPYHFDMDISAFNIPYKNVQEIMTPAVSKKLKKVDLNTIDSVFVKLIGKMKYRDTPYVRADFIVNNQTVTVPQGKISNCSFNGFFLDEMVEGYGHGDPNSMIGIDKLTGDFYGINFTLDDASIKNLAEPILRTKLTSDFGLPLLNEVIGISNYSFNSGDARVRLDCSLPIKENDRRPPNIDGTITFSNASFSYNPRNISIKKGAGSLVFKGKDVLIKDVHLESEKNKLTLNASIDKLLNLYYTNPEKVVIDCKITSLKISLDEYISFLGKRETENKTEVRGASESMTEFANTLDNVMDQSIVKIGLKVNEVVYKKFLAEDVAADVTLSKTDIKLKKVKVKHAGGSLLMDAIVVVKEQTSAFNIDAKIDKVDIKKLFYSFDNFGQTAILDSNIKGILTAKIDATGGIKYSGDIVPRSLNGKIDFDLNNGALIDFEPLGTIGKIIFFNRDLNNITIKPLSGKLDIKNSNIYIQPILVQTSAFNIFTEGTYGIPTGTDILIQVPLRNPKKDNKKLAEKDLKKGIVINMHATDNNTGDVKIKLGKGKTFK